MKTEHYKIWESPQPKKVEIISRSPLTQARWITPQRVECIIDGQEKVWEYVPRKDTVGVVSVLPITTQGEILLIQERRIPFMSDTNQGKTIGLPAGLVDTSENPYEAVIRELQEETGFTSEKVDFIARVTSSEGLTNEEVDVFVAQNCTSIQTLLAGYSEVGGLILKHEGSELIDAIYSIPLGDIDSFLEASRQEGMRRGSKIDTALRGFEKLI